MTLQYILILILDEQNENKQIEQKNQRATRQIVYE